MLQKGDDDRPERVVQEEIRRYTAYLTQTASTPEMIQGKIKQVEKRIAARDSELKAIDRKAMQRENKKAELRNNIGRTPEPESAYEKFILA